MSVSEITPCLLYNVLHYLSAILFYGLKSECVNVSKIPKKELTAKSPIMQQLLSDCTAVTDDAK